MEGLLMFMFGVAAGLSLTMIFKLTRSTTGKFLIDSSDPEKDVFRLDLDKLEDVYKKKVIELKIVRNADLSHE